MRRLSTVFLFLVLPGCYSPVTELVTPHVETGGTISASLDAGPQLQTKALAKGTDDPMTIEGTSAALVFGLIIGDDELTGMAAKPQLLADKAVQMSVTATSRAQMSVHLGGRSCIATSAVIHLTPDGGGHLDGDFAGAGDGCQFGGTLAGVPIEK
ncbi:MAG: hypothetical protein JWN44_3895 [Myxococcales bacterium]|nr:hypothetical protein [Myxococcales bacterium]